jgi:hypothetical protein
MIGHGKPLPFWGQGCFHWQDAIATHAAINRAGRLVRAIDFLAAAGTMNFFGHKESLLT